MGFLSLSADFPFNSKIKTLRSSKKDSISPKTDKNKPTNQ